MSGEQVRGPSYAAHWTVNGDGRLVRRDRPLDGCPPGPCQKDDEFRWSPPDTAADAVDVANFAAAIARVVMLADKWEAERDAPFGEAHMSYAYAAHTLRAALAHPSTDPDG